MLNPTPHPAQLLPEAAVTLVQGLAAALGVAGVGAAAAAGVQPKPSPKRGTAHARRGRAAAGPGSGGGAREAVTGWGMGGNHTSPALRTGGAGGDGGGGVNGELLRIVAHFQHLFSVPRVAGVLPAINQVPP